MKPLDSPPSPKPSLEELVRRLSEAKMALEESYAGQVDSVVLADGSTFLLREARQSLSALQSALDLREKALAEVSQGVLICDEERRIVYTNAGFERLTGYTAAEVLGKTCRILQGAETSPETIAAVRAALHAGQPFEGEILNYRKDGVPFWNDLSITPVRDEQGRLVRFIGIQRDVTPRKRAEGALRASEVEFRNLAEFMPQIVWMTSADGANIYFNERWMDYTGLTLEESLGDGWNKPFHPEDQQRAWEAWQRATTTGVAYSLECRLRRGDGAYRWWLIRGAPQRDADGRILKWFGTCTDIHDLKRAEEEVFRTNRALKMISACDEALIHIETEQELLDRVCRIAVEIGGYRLAWVGYALDDATRRIEPKAHAGMEEGYLSEIDVSWDASRPNGRGPAGRSIRDAEAVVCNDVATDPTFQPWQEPATRRGYRSVVFLPLRIDGRPMGTLGLYSSEPDIAGAEEVRFLQELADDLAFGIATIRSRRESERLQKAVLKIAQGVSGGAVEFFDLLTTGLVEALGADCGIVGRLVDPAGMAIESISLVIDGRKMENVVYTLEGTPCANVMTGDICVFESEVRQRFPKDQMLVDLGFEAYAGLPLRDSAGRALGLLAVLFRVPIEHSGMILSTLRIFASRAAAELERHQTDARVAEQAALLDNARDAILVRDCEERITYWNKSAELLYGWTAREVVGREATEMLYKTPTEFQQHRDELLRDGEWAGEVRQITCDGRELIIDSRWTLLRDAAGRPKSTLVINTDVTERRKSQEAVLERERTLRRQAMAGEKAKSEFLAVMSHEIRTPMNGILGFAEMLAQSPELSPGNHELTQTIVSSGETLLRILDDILDFSRIEAGRLSIERRDFSPGELLHGLETLFARQIQEKGLELRLSLEPGLPEGIYGDSGRIRQILVNLLGNAIKFTDSGSIELRARVLRDHDAGDALEFSVADTGPGIAPDQLATIFEAFTQEDSSISRRHGGTGLGLTISRRLAELMGGAVEVSSEPGVGSTFTLRLPLVLAAGPADAGAPTARPRPPLDENFARRHPQRILVVEDDRVNLKLIVKMLGRLGYEPLAAANGADAIALYERELPDCILMDVQMPGMDGIEATRRIRTMERSRSLPHAFISALTANILPEDRQRCLEAGMDAYLNKPVKSQAVADMLVEAECSRARAVAPP